ncbi:MAG: response regulator transcription factor [Bdellovibrionales bacterium]|nr:response regulator transcription factor [Bdellovibrionales bacterium]
MKKEIHILLVDDQPGYCEFLEMSSDIWNEHFSVMLTHVKSAEEAVSELQSMTPNIIVVDAHLPDTNTLDFVERYSVGESPIVVTSEEHSLSLEESAIYHGAAAYIPKTNDPDEVEFFFARLAELSSAPREIH